MASPFYLFRKYQRAFIAIAAVIAMFIFVVADPLMTWLQSSGDGPQRSANAVVASWDGGEINLMELENLTQRRYKISEFLRNLVGRAARTIEEEGGTPLPPNLPDFVLPNNDTQMVQQGCVTTKVFAQKALESGISVSDTFINHYLKEWGLGKAGDAEIGNLLGQVRLTDKALFAGLRELLLTHFYTSGYSLVTAGVMPEERWQDWKKINERIVLQAAQLPVDDFIAEVPEPSETDLKKFYAEHKDRVGESYVMVKRAPLRSPEPGFRIPRQVKIQYLLGNLDDWTQKLLDKVTDEEIADYYERNKRTQFVKTASSSAFTKPRTTTSAEGLFDDEEDNDEGEVEAEPDTEESTDVESDDSNSDDSNTDAAEAEEPVMTEEEGTASAEDSAAEAPAAEDSPEAASAEEAATEAVPADQPAAEDNGLKTKRSPFRLVALQDESEATTKSETSGQQPADDSEPAATEASDSDADEDGDVDEEVVEFVPLTEVADQIRRVLAEEKATVELEDLFESTSGELEEYYTPYGYSVVEARSEGKEPPSPPAEISDYKALAKKTGLVSEETALLSQLQLSEAIIGRAVDAKTGRQRVHQAMFGDIGLYEPYVAVDGAGNAFIVCKTKDVPSRVPDFEDVRDEVSAAWKKAEAAKLALAKAEELAKSAQESGDTVSVVAGAKNYEVVTTDAFSWLSFGTTQADVQRGPRLSQAPPLESIGEDFMETAFNLEPDEKVAVMNFDKSAAYVIQLDRREQTEAELKQRFLSDSVNGWFGGRIMNSVHFQEAQQQLYANLTEEIGLNLDGLQKLFEENRQ